MALVFLPNGNLVILPSRFSHLLTIENQAHSKVILIHEFICLACTIFLAKVGHKAHGTWSERRTNVNGHTLYPAGMWEYTIPHIWPIHSFEVLQQ